MDRRMKSNKYYFNILLIVSIIIVINLIVHQFLIRFDFTGDQRYTLSDATEDILKNLEDPITVKAYFSTNLPSDIARTRQEFKDLLIEYNQLSGGKLNYEFLDPSEEKVEQEANQNGVAPIMINVREKDQMKQQKAYLGALIQAGGTSGGQEVIPFIQPGGPMEYALSTNIKKLTVTNKPKIGFLQGFGQTPLQNLNQAIGTLSILYDVLPVNLTDTTQLSPLNYKTIVMLAPTDSILPWHLQKLDQYLAQGGNLCIGLNRVTGDLQNAMGSSVETGVENWLASKGLLVENQFIVDEQCHNVTYSVNYGGFPLMQQVPFPYVPIITNFEDHIITEGLEMVLLQFVSGVRYTGDTTLTYQPLAYSSEKSGQVPAPTYFDIQKQWTNADFSSSKIPIAGVLSGNIVGNTPSKIVLIGDGDFPAAPPNQQAQPDNVNLLVNSIDWLSDDTGLIELRTREVTSRPLDELEDGTRAFIKYGNFLSPLLFVLIYGLIRWNQRRNIRIRRLQESYE